MSAHACQTCLELRCCPEHCCDWDDCECGDCENCGGALPIEKTASERFERKQASASRASAATAAAAAAAAAVPSMASLFNHTHNKSPPAVTSPLASVRQPSTRVLSVSLPRPLESELAVTSLDDDDTTEFVPSGTLLPCPGPASMQYVRLRSNDGHDMLVPHHVCAVSSMLQSMLSGQRFLERQAIISVDNCTNRAKSKP
jgi:hypothetical protein